VVLPGPEPAGTDLMPASDPTTAAPYRQALNRRRLPPPDSHLVRRAIDGWSAPSRPPASPVSAASPPPSTLAAFPAHAADAGRSPTSGTYSGGRSPGWAALLGGSNREIGVGLPR